MEDGQIIIYVGKKNYWEYGIITNIFDNCYNVKTKSGLNVLQITETIKDNIIEDISSDNFTILEILKNNKPIIVSKNIFGKRDLTKFIKKNNY